MSKINLNDTMMDMTIKMAEGNPGALAAIMDVMQNTGTIDPQSALGGVGTILSFDDMGIYGSHIYILWNDVCGRNVQKLQLLMRANQLGMNDMPGHRIESLARGDESIDGDQWNEISDFVCGRLSEFKGLHPSETSAKL